MVGAGCMIWDDGSCFEDCKVLRLFGCMGPRTSGGFFVRLLEGFLGCSLPIRARVIDRTAVALYFQPGMVFCDLAV